MVSGLLTSTVSPSGLRTLIQDVGSLLRASTGGLGLLSGGLGLIGQVEGLLGSNLGSARQFTAVNRPTSRSTRPAACLTGQQHRQPEAHP